MADFGLDEIIRLSSGLQSQNADFTAGIVDATKQASAGMRQNASLIQEAGNLQAEIQLKKDTAELQALNQSRANARALGTGPSSASIVAEINSKIRNDLLQYNAASEKLQKLDANDNLLANPLGWLNSLLNRDEVEAAAKGSLDRLNTNTAMLSNMQSLTQSDVRTNLALAETADADTAAKNSRLLAIKAQTDANAANADAAKYDMEGYSALQQLGNQRFSQMVQVYNMRRGEYEFEESKKMQAAHLAIQQARLDEVNDEKLTQKTIAQLVNTAAESMGLNPIDERLIASQYGKPTPIGQQLTQLASIGAVSLQQGSAFLGSSPYDVSRTLQAFDGRLPDSVSPEVVRAMNDTNAELTAAVEAALKLGTGEKPPPVAQGLTAETVKDENSRAKVYNDLFEKKLQAQDAGFASAPVIKIQALEQRFPSIKNTKLYDVALKPLSVSTQSPLSVKYLGELVAEHVARGEISPEVASKELAAISETVFNDRRGSDGRLLMKARLADEASYRIKLTVTSQSPIPYDFAAPQYTTVNINPSNATDWNSYFQRVLVAKRTPVLRETLFGTIYDTPDSGEQ